MIIVIFLGVIIDEGEPYIFIGNVFKASEITIRLLVDRIICFFLFLVFVPAKGPVLGGQGPLPPEIITIILSGDPGRS